MILLDTSVLIELFRVKNKQKSLFFQLSEREESFGISSITHYEILIGSNDMQDEFWDRFFSSITIFSFDNKCSLCGAKIYKELKAKNKLIELADITVAATAIANDLTLATLNRKHFERITGLALWK